MSSKTLYSYRTTPYDLTTALPSGTMGSIRPNIRFMIGDPITCFMPTHFVFSDITSSTATVSWTPHAPGIDYELVIVSDSDDFNSATPITVSDTFYTFSTLSEKTNYRVYLRANCGIDGYSSWVQRSFITPCLTSDVLPYEENFESAGTGTTAFPECWSKITSNGAYPYINMTPDSTLALYFYTTSATFNTAVMPPLDLSLAANPVALTFKAMKTSAAYGRVDVGYMTNPNDINTFTILKSIYPSDYTNVSDWYSFMVPLTNVPTTPLYLALMVPMGGSTSYLYIDDVRVSEMVGCSSPSALTVSSVAGTSAMLSWHAAPYGVTDCDNNLTSDWTASVSFTTLQAPVCNAPTDLAVAADIYRATVVWTPGGDENRWNVQIRANTDEWSEIIVETHTDHVFNNLQPNTPYQVRVQAVCDELNSEFAMISFNTLPDGIADYELGVNLYPNPNNGRFTINNEQLTMNNVQVYDVTRKSFSPPIQVMDVLLPSAAVMVSNSTPCVSTISYWI